MTEDTETIRMSKEDWEALFQRYFPAVQRYFLSHRVGPADAEDLAQEVFKALAQCKVPSEPNPYIHAMARNVLSRHRKRAIREHATLDGYSQYCQAGGKAVGARAFREGSPQESAPEELSQFLKAALGRLPPESAELVELRLREKLSASEIARRMQCSQEAVWKRLQRLRRTLQRYDREGIVG